MILATAGALLLLPLLFAVVLVDLRELRIPNLLLVVFVVLFLITVLPTLSFGEIKERAIIALIVFAVGFVLFLFEFTGAGDVKAITVFALFLRPVELSSYLLLVAIGGVVGLMLVRSMRKLAWVKSDPTVGAWKVWTEVTHFPYGLPLATGLMIIIVLRLSTGTV